MDNRNLGNKYHRWNKPARCTDCLLVATTGESLPEYFSVFSRHALPHIDHGADAILCAICDAQPTFNDGSRNNSDTV